jgi:F0F1-type ATP synthase membrane subunit a
MEHPFTWYNLLPEGLQHTIGDHTFFAIVAAVVLVIFAIQARAALARTQDRVVPVEGIGVRNIAELLVQLVVNQSDAIIGRQGRKYVPFFGTFFFFILLSNLMDSFPALLPLPGTTTRR